MDQPSSSHQLTTRQQRDGELTFDRAAAAPHALEGEQDLVWRTFVRVFRGFLQFLVMVAVLVGASFLMNQLQASRKERPVRTPTETAYTVETIKAVLATNQPRISVFGDVMAGRTLNLTALVGGEVIALNPALRVGERIEKGATLLTINPFSYEIARDEARANLNEARAALSESRARLQMEKTGQKRTGEQLALAEADLERARALLRTNTLTRRDVEERELVVSQRRAAYQTSEANIAIQQAQVEARLAIAERLEAGLKNAEKDLENTVLIAPFDAIVQMVNVEIGQTVTNSLSLMTLYQADTLDVRFVLSDGQYGQFIDGLGSLIGHEVMISWQVGSARHDYLARIDRVGAEIAANRGGVAVFARIEPDDLKGGLRPGAFVSVSIADRLFENTIRLPETALFEGDTTFIVNQENRLEARPVRVLAYDGEDVIIKEGLKEGDEVLITQIAEVGAGLLIRRVGKQQGKTQDHDNKDQLSDQSAHASSPGPRG